MSQLSDGYDRAPRTTLILGTVQPLNALMNNIQKLKSAKAREKTEACESIATLLEGEDKDILIELDHNSVHPNRKNLMTWNSLFNDVQEYCSAEIERAKSDRGDKKFILFTLIQKVMERANRGYPYLERKTVFKFLKEKFENKSYIPSLSKGLFSMLNQFFSTRQYAATMTSEILKDSISFLLKAYSASKTSKDERLEELIVETLNKIIELASDHPTLLPVLRSRVVKFLNNRLVDVGTSVQTKAKLLHSAVLICRQNAIEFRTALCKLGESIIPSLLTGQGSLITNYTFDENSGALIELLLVQVKLHNPCDVGFNSPAFYAFDVLNWINIIQSIYTLCYDSIESFAKARGYHRKGTTLPLDLVTLAVKTTKLVSDSSWNIEATHGEGPSAKKHMGVRSFQSIINDVTALPPTEGQLIWLQYVGGVLDEFPELVEGRIVLPMLFQIGLSLLRSNFVLNDKIYIFLESLLRYENTLFEQKIVQERSPSWTIVWDVTIKSVGRIGSGDSLPHALKLLRRMIVCLQPQNIDTLLQLFVKGSLNVDQHSSSLLIEYLSTYALPQAVKEIRIGSKCDTKDMFTTNPRIALVHWLLSSSHDSSLCDTILPMATILCSVLIKRSHIMTNSMVTWNSELTDSVITQAHCQIVFEKLLLQSSFVVLGKQQETGKNTVETSSDKGMFLMQQEVATSLINLLQEEIDSSHDGRRAEEFIKRLEIVQYRCGLLVGIINTLEKFNVLRGDEFGLWLKSKFHDLLRESLKIYGDIVDNFLKAYSQKLEYVYSLMQITKRLLEVNHLCPNTKRFLVQHYPHQLLALLKRIFRSGLYNYVTNKKTLVMPYVQDDMSVTSAKYSESCSLDALGCLMMFGLMHDDKPTFFGNILTDLLEETFNCFHLFHFDLCEEFVLQIVPVLRFEKGLYTPLFELLQKMCRAFHSNSDCAARLWKIFADLTPVVAVDPEDVAADRPGRKLMRLVGPFFTKLSESGIRVCKAAFNMLSLLAQNDPSLNWSWYPKKEQQDDYVRILLELSKNLNNRSHELRLLAANTVCCVFQASSAIPNEVPTEVVKEAIEKRKKLYSTFYENLLQTYDTEQTGNEEGGECDEKLNRTCLILMSLTNIIFAYPFEQRKVMFGFFQAVRHKSIDVLLASRALKFAQPDATTAMIINVAYILEKWIKLDYPIDNTIPFQFFDCANVDEFTSNFLKEIAVQYFEHNKIEVLTTLAQKHQKSVQELIADCYGEIMGRLAPSLAILTQSRDIIMPKHISIYVQRCNELHIRLVALLEGKTRVETLMVNRIGEIVLNMITLTYNPDITDIWECSEIRLPEPEVLFYDESGIIAALKYLKESLPHQEISVIGYLIVTSPKSLYKILVGLIQRIHEAHECLDKFRRLHHYSVFIDILLSEPKDIFDHLKVFLCQFIIYSYLRFFLENQNDERFLMSVLGLLLKSCRKLVELCFEEMCVHFNFLIGRLVRVVAKYPKLQDNVKKLLHFFLISNKEKFGHHIAFLDPFPDLESTKHFFEEYKPIYLEKKYGMNLKEWPLKKELDICLSESDISIDAVTKQKLSFLKDLLANRKPELKQMVKELEDKRFLEQFRDNVLCKIVRMLVDTTMHSQDEEVIFEAGRCLGEIGAIDLSVLVLPRFGRTSKITATSNALSSLIESISAYLTDDNFQITIVAGQVLQELLEVTECAQLINIIKTEHVSLYSVLIPFTSVGLIAKGTGRASATLLERKLHVLKSNENHDYIPWIIQLTCALIESFNPPGLSAALTPLCKLKVQFCEDILPFVVFYVLSCGRANPAIRASIANYFQHFLTNFVSSQEDNNSLHGIPSHYGNAVKSAGSIYQNKLALRSILGVVQFLRETKIPLELRGNEKLTPWDNNFWWLELNYLDLAKAAQYCGAYLTSILYGEIYAFRCQETETELAENDEFYSQDTTAFPQSRNQAEQVEKILLKAFSSIGEQDAIYGCGYSRLYDFQSNIQYLQQTKKWARSLSMCDVQSSSQLGICQSMKELALYDTLWTYLQGLEFTSGGYLDTNLREIQFECGWRLSKWDLNINRVSYVKNTSDEIQNGPWRLHKFLFESIQNGLSGDLFSHGESLRSGLKTIAMTLRQASLESSVNLYGFLSALQSLRTIEDYFTKNQNEDSIEYLRNKWKLQDEIGCSDYTFQEPILYLRSILLNSFRETQPTANIDEIHDDSIHKLVTEARNAGRLELAEKCAVKFVETANKTRRHVEIARNHCARGEQDLACQLMKRVLSKTTPEEYKPYPALLMQYGEWLFETKSERPVMIIEKILGRACQMFDSRKSSVELEDISKAHLTLAKYADAQYQSVCNYVKSDMFNEKANQLQKAREEQQIVDAAKRDYKDDDIKKSENILRKQANIDQSEMNTTYLEKKGFLLCALSHYLRGLTYSNNHDLLIFRAIGLWLERADFPQDEVARDADKVLVDANLPSYKYIMVLHQLSARMGVNNPNINATINNILMKCAAEHPYHTLPVLLTQAYLHKDKEIRTKQGSTLDRVKCAAKLVQLLKKDKRLQGLITKMEQVWLALIELANVKEAAGAENLQKPMQDNMSLKKLKSIECVPVPITDIPVSSNLAAQQYYPTNIIGIRSFDPNYYLVGGINSPRRIFCNGTNGRKYSMLLKGHDDLRQDALMQQVFGVMNKLLKVEPRAKIRRLQVRTYKVVPLSQRSGVIEWCENTQTFGEYLTGQKKDAGAHTLYRPKDWRPNECRRKMNEVKDCGDNARKIKVFNEILDNFKSVFRHFFFENFKDAGIYFERRLAYTRSVATSSMVGYILGLGDRHVLNILVDKDTAEFIHIDLGVAFEQGRILPTPEPIPFRLTRDVVDGMGVAGVEGVFRRSSELTLEVLRNNSEIILTILEVLLYDPLYIWTLTADRMQKVQPAETMKGMPRRSSLNQSEVESTAPKERNNSAARVLLRLKQKLLGIEEGVSSGSSLSVPGHVSLLIQKAVDPDLLSRVFPGWQPYL